MRTKADCARCFRRIRSNASAIGPIRRLPFARSVAVETLDAPVTGNNLEITAKADTQPMQTTLESPQTSSAVQPEVQPEVPRKQRLLVASRTLMEELSGYDLSEVDPAASLLELGLDSLLLTQAAQVFHKKFGVSISFRQLMEELSSLQAIAEHLDATLAPEAFAAPAAKPVAGRQSRRKPSRQLEIPRGGQCAEFCTRTNFADSSRP